MLPVTVWLAGPGERAADEPLVGLTVSSVLLGQGEPAVLAGLVTPSSDLAGALGEPGTPFAVHVLGAAHRRLAQHFAGELPAPEEMLATTRSAHGPLLDAVGDRALCHSVSAKSFGWSLLVEAEVDEVQLAGGNASEGGGPRKGLAWYRAVFHVVGG